MISSHARGELNDLFVTMMEAAAEAVLKARRRLACCSFTLPMLPEYLSKAKLWLNRLLTW